MNRLEQLYKKLGINKENGLYLISEADSWIHKFPYRISRILKDVIKPQAFYCLYNDAEVEKSHPKPFNQSFILFFDNPSQDEEEVLHKHVINFGLAQAVFINRSNTLDLYHGNEFTLADFKRLRKLQQSNNVDGFEDFSFVNMLLGHSLEKLGTKKNLIDTYLLNNITDARRILVAKNGLNLLPKAANRLIGRLLFVSYLIDRDVTFSDQNYVEGNNKNERKISFRELIKNKVSLYNFFKYLNEKYNGDMFPLKEVNGQKVIYKEEDLVNNHHLDVLYHLFNSSEFFKTGQDYKGYTVQKSFFDLYDFEIIPVELISSIYENFIGNEYENEKLQLSKQKDIKAYYTPAYLVDYVLSQTVSPFLENPLKEDPMCKVLDPSCGSGIFLVETLRKILEKELALTGRKKISDARLWKLIKSNIYGIDIDSDAIDISIFSLYVTILDYKQPAEIEKFRFHKLKDENFFGGIEADFFNTNHPFNTQISGLDFIVGNPPWGKIPKSNYIKYIKDRNEKENKGKVKDERLILKIGDKEICQAFLVRTSDFASPEKELKCSFIVSSKVLYNSDDTKVFRNYFLSKFHVKQVVELSPVNNKIRGGNHIFDNAKYPAAVITYIPETGNKTTTENVIQHITVKPNRFFLYYKTIVIEKHDVKNIKQSYFIEEKGGFDWLWKVLVHGNALDIHFIRKLKQLKHEENSLEFEKYDWKGGLKIKDGTKKNDTSKILNYDYLEAESEFRPFVAMPSKKWKREAELKQAKDNNVGYLPDLKFFQGNKLLFKKGVVLKPNETEHHFGAVTAFHEGKISFSSTVASLIPISKDANNSKEFLSSLSSLFNSKLFTYYTLNTGSSLGIEKSRIHFDEFFSFPIKYDNKLAELALNITNKLDDFGSNVVAQSKKAIEKKINQLYGLTQMELSLLDYATTVSIPVLLREKEARVFKPLNFEKQRDVDYMNEYLGVFLKSFQVRFDRINKRLRPEILYTDFFIRINFYVENKDRKQPANTFRKTGNDDLEMLLGDLGVYNVCKNLYIQQDVRGFTKNSFYVIKPNEHKLWHNAVAYLDAMEFEEEITKAEIKNHQK